MDALIALVALLIVAIVVVEIGNRTKLPWPALLTVLAAGALLIPGLPTIEIPSELILPIFLPPLLWALARRNSWAAIKIRIPMIISLSVLLVFVTVAVLTSALLWLLPGIGLGAAMLLASALAPPDPVAVDAVAEPAGIPRRLVSTLHVEGLFNDAASIVAFHVALAAVLTQGEIDFGSGILKFLWAALSAVVIGLLVGRASAWAMNRISSVTARTSFNWVIPFAVYLGAEEIHSSGVIAIVIAAVEFSSRASLGAEDRLASHAFWEPVEMMFSAVAFGLIGLHVRDAIDAVGADLWSAVGIGVVLSLLAIGVRLAWFSQLLVRNKHRRRRHVERQRKRDATEAQADSVPDAERKYAVAAPVNGKEVILLTWSGMRGLVTLALVLAIPANSFIYHHEAAVIALVVLLMTMVVPGLLLPWLVERLDLEHGSAAFEDHTRENLIMRAQAAARAEIQAHEPEVSEDILERTDRFIAQQFGSTTDFELEHDEAMQSRLMQLRQTRKLQEYALIGVQKELVRTRNERGVIPGYVDEILETVDALIVASHRAR